MLVKHCLSLNNPAAFPLEVFVEPFPQQILFLTSGRWQEFNAVTCALLVCRELLLQLCFFPFPFPLSWDSALKPETATVSLPYRTGKGLIEMFVT